MTLRLALLFLIGLSLGFGMHEGRAGNSAITHVDFKTVISAKLIAPSGTFTQVLPFTGDAIIRTVNQAVQVQGTGTSPNYKVELLVTLDGTNYAKPEIGGDLGTFTDANLHIIPLYSPVCTGNELKITELGSSNSITITAGELSQ